MSKITKKQILSLCSIIHNSVEYLNHGGCGVFAFLVGSTMNKFENCQVKVKIVDYYGNFHGNYLAHLRLRYGYFTVTLECGKRVYETCTIGDGVFECSEREYHLDKAIEAIRKHYDI